MTDMAQILSFKHEIQCHRLLPQSLEKSCLAHEDLMEIYPMMGKKKVIKLKRTNYQIISSSKLTPDNFATKVYLKSLPSDNEKEFSLSLESMKLQNGSLKKVYVVRSHYDFKLNGQWVREAILKTGDILDFALSRVVFKDSKSENSSMLENQIKLPVAKSNLPVLIEGETGTGKTFLAKKVHEVSGVRGRFVHLNLASFSESLIESELFGHCKGAFTGASREKRGAFVEASNGTLFLDEIDSLPKSLQTKLLLFLDDGKVRSVGSNYSTQVKTRIIAASGSNLKLCVEKDLMRKDFYHRLASGISIQTRPLRENPQMICKIMNEFSQERSRAICKELVEQYQKMPWYGNIRELKGHLEKKHISDPTGLIRWDEFDEQLLMGDSSQLIQIDQSLMTFRQLKKAYAQIAISRCDNNLSSAAKILGISVNTLKRLNQAAKMDEIYI